MKVKDMTMTALFAAMICVMAPWSFSAGAVPITLATLAIYLASLVLGWKRATAAVVIYILLGAVGVPVFSNLTGGLQKLVGPTGGYIAGYIPLALIAGLIADRLENAWGCVIALLAGTLALYALGTAWFCVSLGKDLGYAMGVCVLPFLPGDAIKVALATIIAIKLRPLVKKQLNS
ncbi:MAG: biotin transporter BioY [Oscillospiraceae bacterium]|nr:biotin transporter BioY [Oscillospiraceae bacterium]